MTNNNLYCILKKKLKIHIVSIGKPYQYGREVMTNLLLLLLLLSHFSHV